MLKFILKSLGVCSVASVLGIFILLVMGELVGWEGVDGF